MNWGHKIIIVYGIFIAGIVTLVILSSRENQDLVTEDYYEQELKYQDRINEAANVHALSDTLKYAIQNDELIITLPNEMNGVQVKADVLLYNPTNKNADQRRQITTLNGMLSMPIALHTKGLQVVKLSWTTNEKKFYTEHKLILP